MRAGHDTFSHRQINSSQAHEDAVAELARRGQSPRARPGLAVDDDRSDSLGDDLAAFFDDDDSPSADVPRRAISCSLWSVAMEMVVPLIARPARATPKASRGQCARHSHRSCSAGPRLLAGKLEANAHRGNFAVAPSLSRSASSSSLITTRRCRTQALARGVQRAQKSITASIPAQDSQCGSTGQLHAASVLRPPRGISRPA